MEQSIIKDKLYQFAIRVAKFYSFPKHEKKEFILFKQVLRSSTSIITTAEKLFQAKIAIDFMDKLLTAKCNIVYR